MIKWSNGLGVIQTLSEEWSLAAKPVLGFDFDGIFYDEHTSLKYIGTGRVMLTDAEVALVESYLTGATNPSPPTTSTLLIAAKAVRSEALNGDCAAAIYAGFTSSALGTAHTYPAKDRDQSNLIASVTASLYPGLASDWATPFWCEDSGGAWAYMMHSVSQIQQVGIEGKAAILGHLSTNAYLQGLVQAATTVAAVEAITWSN